MVNNPTPQFNLVSRASTVANLSETSRKAAVQIADKSERVKTWVRDCYERNREKWTNRTFRQLLGRQGQDGPSLRPTGVQVNQVPVLKARASRIVEGKQARRLARISVAETKMMRALSRPSHQFNRTASRGPGLGE